MRAGFAASCSQARLGFGACVCHQHDLPVGQRVLDQGGHVALASLGAHHRTHQTAETRTPADPIQGAQHRTGDAQREVGRRQRDRHAGARRRADGTVAQRALGDDQVTGSVGQVQRRVQADDAMQAGGHDRSRMLGKRHPERGDRSAEDDVDASAVCRRGWTGSVR